MPDRALLLEVMPSRATAADRQLTFRKSADKRKKLKAATSNVVALRSAKRSRANIEKRKVLLSRPTNAREPLIPDSVGRVIAHASKSAVTATCFDWLDR